MISKALLISGALSPFILVTAHFLAYRILGMSRRILSPQFFLIKLILFLNLPMWATVWTIAMGEQRDYKEIGWMLGFISIIFNGVGYAYFHFFNMSETSRRVRLLVTIRKGCTTHQEIAADYSSAEMIHLRLRRLEEMRQIIKGGDGRYRVSGRFFLGVALMIQQWRQWLRMEKGVT